MDYTGEVTKRQWLYILLVLITGGGKAHPPPHVCLTGTMLDVQNWVNKDGELTVNDTQQAIDVSGMMNPTSMFVQEVRSGSYSTGRPVLYLSMARCGLTRVPSVFDWIKDHEGRFLSYTLEYLTFYGNRFMDLSVAGEEYDEQLSAVDANEVNSGVQMNTMSKWSVGLQRVPFPNLRELDLRKCGISILSSMVFVNVPRLEALYLSDNVIHTVSINAFTGLHNLLHLDLSRNYAKDEDGNSKALAFEMEEFNPIVLNLTSLDLSNTKISMRRISALRNIIGNMERLSLCYTGNIRLPANVLNSTRLKYLDLSGNSGILSNRGVLNGLESTLEVLYANDIGLSNFALFENFSRLEILKLGNNEISYIKPSVAETLTNLQAIDLKRNRLTNWFGDTFKLMKSLKLLDLRRNTINIISGEMINDLANVSFLGLSENSMVCNCHTKDFIELALRNEKRRSITSITPLNSGYKTSNNRFDYHSGYVDTNNIIFNRNNISTHCDNDNVCDDKELDFQANFVLVDYEASLYSCFKVSEGEHVSFFDVKGCVESRSDLMSDLEAGRRSLIALLAIPGILMPSLIVVFIFRRNLRYCYVTMRNSAMLSMVNKNKIVNDDTIFNYDLFVSYCNEDRPWVLDQLLSHLETDCSVSLCLHERDFQVGLSILENIVSCMDRSKSIMLVISQKFLRSQWCQFEMHLAQHRLLETRREDLILILLEEIPRRLRPNTLHYLMLTKTYIVWPKNKSEQPQFWRRLKKSVITHRQKHENRVSFA